MQWFGPGPDINTNARRAQRLGRLRAQIEAWWGMALEGSVICSRVVTTLEAAEANLDQDLLARKNPVWTSAQGKVLKAVRQGTQACQAYLNQAPAAHVLWTRQCFTKASEVCQEKLCRPDPEVQYLERDGENVPVCGALKYLLQASAMPAAEDVYESQVRGWDPNKFRSQGGQNAATDSW